MAMVYTLVTSAKEWLTEKFGQDETVEDADEDDSAKEDVHPIFRTFFLKILFSFILILFLR